MADELLSPRQVDAEYGIPYLTLQGWRWRGIGPAYIKMSSGRGGRIKYRRSVIETWLDTQTVTPRSIA